MKRIDLKTGEETKTEAAFHSEIENNLPGTNEKKLLNSMIEEVWENMANFQRRGSNWRFEEILKLELHLVEFSPLKGNSWFNLPEKIKKKKAVINMKNEDNECFKWCVTRALNKVDKNKERITQELRKQAKEFNWDGISFPMEVDKIDRFEKNNPKISIHVFYLDGNVQPLRIGDEERKINIDLLLVEKDGNKHYSLINSLSRLLSKQVAKDKKTKVFCRRCLNHFPNNEKLKIHKEYCSRNEAVKIVLPEIKTDKNGEEERKPEISFKNWNRLMEVPFVVYADFECFLENIDSCEPDNRRSFTEKYQKHKPCGFSYKIVCSEDIFLPESLLEPVLYRAENADEDVAQIFVNRLEMDIYLIYKIYDKPKKMIYTRKDKEKFIKSEECWICERGFSQNDVKVRDHCHFTGKFRGAAHNDCNLKVKKPKFTPVFHNLSGYDSHLFLNLGKSEGDITCIPNNEEKYISFSKKIQVGSYLDKDKKEEKQLIMHEIRFLDSAKFMASSLDSLVKNLGKEKLHHVRREFRGKTDLISRKGVYPYDYMDCFDKLSEEKRPPKEKNFQ